MNGPNYPDRCEELVKKAAMPDSVGGNGQPMGRPMENPQERDANHPMGTNERERLSGNIPIVYP